MCSVSSSYSCVSGRDCTMDITPLALYLVYHEGTVTIYGHNIIVFLPLFCLGIQKFHDALEQHELRWEFVFVFNLITSNVFVIISSNAISKQTRRHGSAAFLNSTTCQRCSCWLRVLDSWPEAYFNIKSSHVSNFYGQDDKLTFLFSHFASVGNMLF